MTIRDGTCRILILCALVWGCRVPDPPLVPDQSSGIIYDTAYEASLRTGTAPRLLADAYAPYVDSLAEPVAITEWTDATCTWDVFVGTNRGRLESVTEETSKENQPRGTVNYGLARVILPRQARGTEPRSSRRFAVMPVLGRKASPESVASVSAESLPREQFLAGVTNQVEQSRQRDLLVFVHGFNVSFDAALIRTAQVALHLPFNGAVVAYCWPSQGGLNRYDEDEVINQMSVEPFLSFLDALRRGVPHDTRIHVIVHSMGNRIVMQALSRRASSGDAMQGRSKPFANVVLCAPDVGQADYQKWIPGVVAQSDRVTLYCHAGDSALIISKGLHGESRAGDAWSPATAPGVEVVDCSRVDLSLMGHSYYGSNASVLSDLFLLVKCNQTAAERPHLQQGADGVFTFHASPPLIFSTWHFEESQESH